MTIRLADTKLFQGFQEEQIQSLLACLEARTQIYPKGAVIMAEGSVTRSLGLVLSGRAIISRVDVWGNSSILGHVDPGVVFGEVYACIPGQPLLVSVTADEQTRVLLLDVERVMTTCARACDFHARLIGNLLQVCALRSLELSRRIGHTSAKTIRGRLLSYFSQCAKEAGGSAFRIPYDRQQLADYLGVDRSALSNELSKMKREGLIDCEKNRVQLKVEG